MTHHEAEIVPYQASGIASGRSVIVFAPHPDDEVFGCGGALALHAQAGQTVNVVLLTAGDCEPGVGSNADYAKMRLDESAQAAAALGIAIPQCWHLLDRSLAYGESLVLKFMDAIMAVHADIAYAPSLWEAHPDHRATAMCAIEAMRRLGGDRQLFLYELSAPLRPNFLLDVTQVWDQKFAAMTCFPSQNRTLDYPDFIGSLNRYRALTLPPEIKRVEGFERYPAALLGKPGAMPFESEHRRLFERGLPGTGADIPLVTVIVRTMGRASLSQAIDSLIAQTYSNLELVLVDAVGTGITSIEPKTLGFSVRIASANRHLGRAAAANAGLEAAQGELCIFLDDDDWFYPDHLAKLVHKAVANRSLKAVHTAVECVDGAGQLTGQVFDFPYSVNELKYGNFMPIHSVIFSRDLVNAGCRFDEAFDLYEDWDFWLQIEQRTAIGFCPGVSAAYRVDAASGEGVHVDAVRARLATQQIFSKWKVTASETTFDELIVRSLAKRAIDRQIAGLHRVALERDREIQRLSELARNESAQAASSQSLANAARLDAHQLRESHDKACRDRDMARGAVDLAQSQVAIARDDAQKAAVEVGLARADANHARRELTLERTEVANTRELLAEIQSQLDQSIKRFNDTKQAYDDQLEVALQARQLAENEHKVAQNALKDAASARLEAHAALEVSKDFKNAASIANERLEALQHDMLQLQAEIGSLNSNLANVSIQRDHLAARIQLMLSSTSWRVSSPIRAIGSVVRKFHTVVAALTVARKRMGWQQITRQTLNVLEREGLAGVRQRMSRLLHPVVIPTSVLVSEVGVVPGSYADWVAQYDAINSTQRQALCTIDQGLFNRPLVSIVMPVHNPVENDLRRAIESVVRQIYVNWELCICDDASSAPHVRPMLENFAKSDKRIRVSFQKKNGHISKASNFAIEMATGAYVAFLDHDDELASHALLRVVEAINGNSEARVFYSDEDKIRENGERFDPYFKPNFNLGLLRSHNYMCHFAVYEAGLLRQLGGLKIGFEGAQDYDLALRAVDQLEGKGIVHLPHVLYHWRTSTGSTAAGHTQKSYAFNAGQRALTEHLARRGLGGEIVEASEAAGMYRVRWQISNPAPLVSIVIPTRNGEAILRQCLDSLKKTSYPNFEIIVIDNGSDDAATLSLLEQRRKNGQIAVLRDQQPFNFSALNNNAVRCAAKGEYVLLLNNDVEVINADWLEEMVGAALEDGVGCVGARLWYPDGRLQHAGVVLVCGVAGHAHKYLPRGQHGYMGRAVLAQDMIGVTAACLLVRKAIYLEVGGLDESLAVAFNDVDFCLKVHSAGYRNHWTPYAELIHHESLTRGYEDTPEKQTRFRGEIEKMQARWAGLLASDPCYSPNLTDVAEDLSYAWPPRRELP